MTEIPKFDCQECHDSGWVRIGDRLKCCQCWTEKIIQAALPIRFQSALLTDFAYKSAVRRGAEDWLLNPTDGLAMLGGPGAGKTHMAAAIVRSEVMNGRRVKFVRASDFYAAIRSTYQSTEGKTEQHVLYEHNTPRMLVLDDLGAGGLSDHERRFTLELLDTRVNNRRPTVVTSNWTIDEIAAKMDERIASRLRSFTVLAFTGKDRRAK